jgi:hypothetical protein
MLGQALSYHGVKLLLVGGGFYVVPLPRGSSQFGSPEPKYRKGYGIHNIFLFPLEQAGLVPFFLALFLWFLILSRLKSMFKTHSSQNVTSSLSKSMFIYAIALIIVGIGGQVFWLGFGTENFTFYQMTMFLIATSPNRPVLGGGKIILCEERNLPGMK